MIQEIKLSKKILKNTVYKTLLNICNIIIPVIVSPYIVRRLDKDLYATYNAAYANFQVFLLIGGLGIYDYGLREISKVKDNKKMRNIVFSELFYIMLISNIITFLLFVIFLLFFSNGMQKSLYIIFSTQFLGNLFYIEWYNEACEDYQFIAKKSIINKILYLILILLFVRKSTNVLAYAFIVSFIYILNNLLSCFHIAKCVKIVKDIISIKRHVKSILTFFFVSNIVLLYNQLDKVMLGHWVSELAVSIYQIPNYIVNLLIGLLSPILVVSISQLTGFYNNRNYKQYSVLFENIIKAYYFLLIPMIFGVYLYSDFIIILYGGTKYYDCIIPMRLFAIATAITTINNILTMLVLTPTNNEKIIARNGLIGGVSNFLINVFLIIFNSFSPETAIGGLIISTLVAFIFNYKAIKQIVKVELFPKEVIRFAASSICFIIIRRFFLNFSENFYVNCFLGILFSGVIYLLINIKFVRNIIVSGIGRKNGEK